MKGELLWIKFYEEFKQYLAEFGAIYSEKIEIKGITKIQGFNVISFTIKMREFYENIPGNFYAISEIENDDSIIWQDENGFIYKTVANEQPRKIATSLNEYIENIE